MFSLANHADLGPNPPSTSQSEPLTYLEFSKSNNVTTFATSPV